MMTEKHIRQLQTALAHQKEGRFAEAIKICSRLLHETPDNFDCIYLSGLLYAQQGDLKSAIEKFRRGVELRPDILDVHYNLAVALSMAGNYGEAAQNYERVLKIAPRHSNARNNYAACLLSKGQFSDALQQYDELIAFNPGLADAYLNRGMTLQNLKRFAEALSDYDKAISLKPIFPEAYVNRGNVLGALDRPDDALASYDKAIALKSDFADAFNNAGNIQFNRRSYEQALAAFTRSLSLRPNDFEARSMRLAAKMHLCDWNGLETDLAQFLATIGRRKSSPIAKTMPGSSGGTPWLAKAASPSAVARLTDDPAVILASAIDWLGENAGHPTPFTHVRPSRTGKIRLGYLSQDLRQHVTGLNWVELFEKHDRSRFELFGFSLAPDDGSAAHKRIASAFDHFQDLSAVADEAAARHIHDLEIDVLVEMVPHSLGSRPAILARRPAPIQINGWSMGYSAGAAFFDYIVADKWMLPLEQQPFFLEKIVHLPHTCFAHDSTQAISVRTPTRSEAGLPEQGFVFCCFNASYKIFPQFFQAWMGLLREVAGSVLWLARHNNIAVANLQAEASKAGIDPARLIFAERLPAMADHLARHRLADLFLDTLPYNAQVTAMDALWAGLPVLTCAGRSYAGRIAASQLHGIEVPELIADDLAAYERLALALARDPQRLSQIKAKVAANRVTTPLFDTERLCRELEVAYERMVGIWRRGENPRSFSVGPM
jgi:protein O-GlcNAc transferase